MAKMIQVSKAEHEMLVAAYAEDGLLIAKLEEELAQAKEDIRMLLVSHHNQSSCQYCKCDPAMCNDCEMEAAWRGYRSDAKT
jgi:hypothetical protein